MDIKEGDLIFVKGRGPIKSVIDWAENGIYHHVAVYAGNGQVLEAQGGRRIGYAPLSEYEGTFDLGKVLDVTEAQRIEAMVAAKKRIGAAYSWKLVILLALKLLFHVNRPYHKRNAEICSTYAVDLWADAHVLLTNADKPTPQDLADSPRISITKSA